MANSSCSFFFSFMFCSICVASLCCSSTASPFIGSIFPNFTASFLELLDDNGDFLVSPNGKFTASISCLNSMVPKCYFSVVYLPLDAVIWTANRDNPVSMSDKLFLTVNGVTIESHTTGLAIWSTPPLSSSSAGALQLQDSGNLLLVDRKNVSLWESFSYPTDTIVMGQKLAVGTSLRGSVSDYELTVAEDDVILQWKEMTYWKLSMEYNSFQNSNGAASFLVLNANGFSLLGNNGTTVVMQKTLVPADFRLATLGSDGSFTILTVFKNDSFLQEFRSPADNCEIPMVCGKLGLCTAKQCTCLPKFRPENGTCTPSDTSLVLPSPCNGTNLNSPVFFVPLEGYEIDYFALKFMAPAERSVSLSMCQDICSRSCSCLGFFHRNSSGSCYFLDNQMGSLMSGNDGSLSGYIKAVFVSTTTTNLADSRKGKFPVAGLVLIPSAFLLLVYVVASGLISWRRKRMMSSDSSFSSFAEFDIITIPGLPKAFSYEELAVATANFSSQIGRGGFGTVYKGTLPDQTVVAVKELNNVGVQAKKFFCTETAIIGSIHHVNLVKLIGFCAQGKQWFQVYEYMSGGSLEHTLFGKGSVLEWQERFEIALGTARGLAYLHSCCEPKILHCDVKPENILLDANLQAKISDFGLSKLMSPDESNPISTMRGTRGYLAPEWIISSSVSDKSDVYSYGMVLLEIVTGKRNYTSSSEADDILFVPQIALEKFQQQRCLDLADPMLKGRVTSQEVEKLVTIALCCLHKEPNLRPCMAKVVGMLEGAMPMAEPRMESLDFLRVYGVAGRKNNNGREEGERYVMSAEQVSAPR